MPENIAAIATLLVAVGALIVSMWPILSIAWELPLTPSRGPLAEIRMRPETRP